VKDVVGAGAIIVGATTKKVKQGYFLPNSPEQNNDHRI